MSKTEEEQEAPPPARQGKFGMVIALTVGMAAGAAGGSIMVGPLLADGPPAECEDLFADGEKEETRPAPAAVYTIENLVLNPAGSGGTRFLMATVGVALNDAAIAEQMSQREAEIRDIALRVLGSKTVGQLSDMGFRTELKEEFKAELATVTARRGTIVDVYFPQFVIQ